MTLDYSRYPTDLVGSGNVKGKEKPLTVDDLRRKIPAHCFKPSNVRSFLYLLRDFSSVALFAWLAHIYISLIPNPPLRWLAWALYGWIQGLAFTGSWVQGHEAGHGAVSTSRIINDVVGFLVHSALLTPYFSWNSTHRRHHIYHNNLEKDVSHVPLRLQQYAIHLGITPERLEKMEELGGDVPLVLIIRIIMQQLLGWPLYLLNNVSASTGSMYRPRSKTLLGNSHFLPGPTIFRPEEAHLILASDIGLLSMMAILYYAGLTWGFANVALFYRQPYLWVNHWIVCITFLHHNAPNVPKYMPELWTFLKGGLATHMLHSIADYHVARHLFARISQYHAEEATKAIMPLLGDAYHSDSRGVIETFWETYTKCQWVKSGNKEDPKERAFWYQAGVCPAPATQI